MQQLTLPFDGYADSRPAFDVSATKRRRLKVCEILPGWALLQQDPSAALDRVVSNVKTFAQATLIVCFCYSLMFLAAILQG